MRVPLVGNEVPFLSMSKVHFALGTNPCRQGLAEMTIPRIKIFVHHASFARLLHCGEDSFFVKSVS